MNENERRIMDVFAKGDALSKRDITSRCGIGWATAVKHFSRLVERGYLVSAGTERQRNAGKSAVLYALSPTKPVALGIDVEYGRVRWGIENLTGKRFVDKTLPTPAFGDSCELALFLADIIVEAKQYSAEAGFSLEGIGIGVPSRLFGPNLVPYSGIAGELENLSRLPVSIENNIKCFSQAIVRKDSTPDSVLIVTVRSGIGVGIVSDGKLYQGERGSSGEIGHFPVDTGGKRCRCGRTGCLETIVNRDELVACLGTPGTALEGKAELLGKALGMLILVTDIRTVLLYSELGESGNRLVPVLRAAVGRTVYPGLEFEIRYEPLDPDAYVSGAANLALAEFI